MGDGIFETVKAVDGRLFALTRHLDRLTLSARGLGLPDPDHDEVRRACAAVLEANPMPLGRLRITYTGGHGPLGSDRGEHGPTLVVALGESAPRPDSTAVITVPWTRNERGALTGLKTTRGEHGPTLVVALGESAPRPDSTAVITVPWTRNERGALTGLKTTSYAENVVALARARADDASEALFANTVGQLCEGTGSNVFVVLDGEIHTPPLASGCLAGITRALTVEWTGARETDLPLDVLERADEIFLTSTLRDVQAVHRVDARELPGAPGPVTAKAMRIFQERAGNDLDP
ncbi:aminodeoxychorismate lyase [Streptomyces canus]|uniref:aminodeoxychorismate lyase n=1 Tax=Streptomyces canus TaxID=58343 RepID=UPI0036ED22A1